MQARRSTGVGCRDWLGTSVIVQALEVSMQADSTEDREDQDLDEYFIHCDDVKKQLEAHEGSYHGDEFNRVRIGRILDLEV
jgi:hypothetical protein